MDTGDDLPSTDSDHQVRARATYACPLAGGEPAGVPWGDWLPPGRSLADVHLNASPTQLSGLVRAAREAYHREWPCAVASTLPDGPGPKASSVVSPAGPPGTGCGRPAGP